MINPYEELDLKCIPFESFDKLNRKWKGGVSFTQKQWDESNVIGVINGEESGGLITIDVDSKKDITKTLNKRVLQAFKIMMPDVYDSVYIETTKSDGLHIMYRVEGDSPAKTIPANTMVWNEKLNKYRKEALIEVLGEGQQTFVHPSAGYSIISGSLEDLPTLDLSHHNELMEMCKQFNEVPEEKPVVIEHGGSETKRGRAGDLFNERAKNSEMRLLFEKHDWEIVKEFDEQFWLRRPEKDSGISATWNFEGRKLLMVFSTSTDFSSTNHDGTLAGYTAFQVLTKLEFKGDFKKCASVLKEKGYKDDGAELWHELELAENSYEIKKVLNEKGVEFVMGLDHNGKVDFVDKINHAFGRGTINKKYIDNIQTKRHDEISIRVDSDSWEDNLRGDSNDLDLMQILDNDETYCKSFGTNTFSNEITIVKPIKGVCDTIKKDGTPLTDRMERLVWQDLAKRYDASFQSTSISRNLDVLASRNEYHPIQTKLAGLKWDGKHRLNTWLQDYCGSSDRLEIQMMGRKFLIGAVARIFKRGCKMDNALILKSVEQGMKKSTLPQVLSYGYSTDNIGEIGSKDCTQKCQGNWFIELAELDGLKKAKLETIKRWLSSDNDDEIMKYEKRKTKLPRQFVIIGTTNEEKLFSDNEFRRFWAVDVTKIDIEGLLKVRDQLWAEAVQAFQSGEPWWFEDESILKSYHDESRERHQFEDEIVKFCEGRDFIFTKDLYFEIYGRTTASTLAYTAQRAKEFSPILRRLNYRQGAFCSKTKRNGWKLI